MRYSYNRPQLALCSSQKADMIVIMKDGAIDAAGSYEELMAAGRSADLYPYADSSDASKNADAGASSKIDIKGSGGDVTAAVSLNKLFAEVEDENALYKTEKSAVGVLDIRLYAKYLGYGFHSRGYAALGGLLLLISISQSISVLSDWWLAEWAADDASGPGHSDDWWRWSYLCALAILITAASARSLAFAAIAHRASFHIHSKVMSILNAPMAYFDVTPVGRLTNKFSRDMDATDMFVPSFLSEFLESIVFLTSTVVVCAIYVPIILAVCVPAGYLFYRFRSFFSANSRELKRMQATTRSPLYTLFAETCAGLEHIRAFNMQDVFKRRFLEIADRNCRVFFHAWILVPYSILRMDILGSLLILSVSIGLVALEGRIAAASAGLALAYSLQLMGRLQMSVSVSIELENNMISVERLQMLNKIPQEKETIGDDEHLVPKAWPNRGAVEFKDVKIRYRAELPDVVKGVSLSVPERSFVGVCGRTGSGKSTLLSAVLRLVDIRSGSIHIDGLNISHVPLQTLRKRIASVPQDCFLLSGTMRENLDPVGEFDDEAIWHALRRARLETHIRDLGGLDAIVDEGGSNFSVGEKQLISIARAILRDARIVVLDEATANIDGKTDAMIQRMLKSEFSGITTFVIAHRIDTIIDADLICRRGG